MLVSAFSSKTSENRNFTLSKNVYQNAQRRMTLEVGYNFPRLIQKLMEHSLRECFWTDSNQFVRIFCGRYSLLLRCCLRASKRVCSLFRSISAINTRMVCISAVQKYSMIALTSWEHKIEIPISIKTPVSKARRLSGGTTLPRRVYYRSLTHPWNMCNLTKVYFPFVEAG